MARNGRSRLKRDEKENMLLEEEIGKITRKIPTGSAHAHPRKVCNFVFRLCTRYGSDLKIRLVEEIGGALMGHIDKQFFPDECALSVIMFPESTFGYREFDYEVGALCSEVMAHIDVRGPIREAVGEYLFYRRQRRWFDAIEAASRALIEAKKGTVDEKRLVASVRKIELAALRRTFRKMVIAKANT